MINRYKFPRTFHFPWSGTLTSDDKRLTQRQIDERFKDKITNTSVKMDGENTTIYSDGYTHARSLDSNNHASRNYVKQLAARIAPQLPSNMRICGENLYAKHSIAYNSLEDYFYVFAIIEEDTVLSIYDTEYIAAELELPIVPLLYQGPFNKTIIHNSYELYNQREECEGYVTRPIEAFNINEYSDLVAKYVRANHVQNKDHWLNQAIIPNKRKDQQNG